MKNCVSDSMQEVCLTKPDTTVNEEWVVTLTWLLSDTHSCGVTELIAVTNHEILEGVARVYVVKNLSFHWGLGRNSSWLN